MDRCAVLVDAGYLLGAAGTLLGHDLDRSMLEVDHAELTRELIREAADRTGMPVLRLLWYDGAFNGQPTAEHRTLRVLPDVKVRLGELVKRGGRIEQKGVDSYLHRDLTTLARNRAAADVVLLGGDEDLRRALEEAQDYGARVHLWGVEAAAIEYNQSQTLIAEADRRWVIPADWIKRHVRLRVTATTPVTAHAATSQAAIVTAPDLADAASASSPQRVQTTEPAPADIPSEPVAREVVTPADLARLVSAFAKDAPIPGTPAGGRGWDVHDDDAVPRLREITTGAQAWQDNEADATAAGRTPAEVGLTFGRRWFDRASTPHVHALLATRPRLPRRLDGELLTYAERQGVDTRAEDEIDKHAVRAGFWAALDDPGSDELAGTPAPQP